MSVKTVALGEVASIVSGFAFKSGKFNTTGDGLPLVRIRDVTAGRSTTFYSGPYRDDFVVNEGDALIGMDGEFNLGIWQGGKALLNQRVCRVESSDDRLSQAYLIRFLPNALKAIEARTPFVTVKHLSVKELRAIPIPLPPLKEQRRIATTLGKVDALRATRRKAIAKLDQLLQSVFLDMFGDLVATPNKWEISTLGDECLELKNGYSIQQNSDASGVPISRIETISGGVVDMSRVGFADLRLGDVGDHLLQKGDILFSHINSTKHLCKCAIYLESYGPLVHGMNLLRLRAGPRIEPFYLLHLIKSDAYRASLMRHENRAVNQSSIAAGKLKGHSMPVPPLEVQRRFAEIVERTGRALEVSSAAGMESEKLFHSLERQAFPGTL